MIIPLKDGWRISSDRYCWIVQRYNGTRDRNGKVEEVWAAETYHQTLPGAMQSFYELCIRTSPVEGVDEVCRVVEETRQFIKEKWSEFDDGLKKVR